MLCSDMSCLCVYLFVYGSALKSQTVYAINTKVDRHIVHGSQSACTLGFGFQLKVILLSVLLSILAKTEIPTFSWRLNGWWMRVIVGRFVRHSWHYRTAMAANICCSKVTSVRHALRAITFDVQMSEARNDAVLCRTLTTESTIERLSNSMISASCIFVLFWFTLSFALSSLTGRSSRQLSELVHEKPVTLSFICCNLALNELMLDASTICRSSKFHL